MKDNNPFHRPQLDSSDAAATGWSSTKVDSPAQQISVHTIHKDKSRKGSAGSILMERKTTALDVIGHEILSKDYAKDGDLAGSIHDYAPTNPFYQSPTREHENKESTTPTQTNRNSRLYDVNTFAELLLTGKCVSPTTQGGYSSGLETTGKLSWLPLQGEHDKSRTEDHQKSQDDSWHDLNHLPLSPSYRFSMSGAEQENKNLPIDPMVEALLFENKTTQRLVRRSRPPMPPPPRKQTHNATILGRSNSTASNIEYKRHSHEERITGTPIRSQSLRHSIHTAAHSPPIPPPRRAVAGNCTPLLTRNESSSSHTPRQGTDLLRHDGMFRSSTCRQSIVRAAENTSTLANSAPQTLTPIPPAPPQRRRRGSSTSHKRQSVPHNDTHTGPFPQSDLAQMALQNSGASVATDHSSACSISSHESNNAFEDAQPKADVLADLTVLQREVDALRRKMQHKA